MLYEVITIFLDEIGDITPLIQLKLLRVIQEKTISKIGDNKEVKVDMRIVTATNKNLRSLVNQGTFREDLFYRLNVFPILTIPLRNRENDIPLLCDHFIDKFNKQTGKNIHGLTENALRLILDYCWPGNRITSYNVCYTKLLRKPSLLIKNDVGIDPEP